jgi:hypothetical protein
MGASHIAKLQGKWKNGQGSHRGAGMSGLSGVTVNPSTAQDRHSVKVQAGSESIKMRLVRENEYT